MRSDLKNTVDNLLCLVANIVNIFDSVIDTSVSSVVEVKTVCLDIKNVRLDSAFVTSFQNFEDKR